MKTLQIFTLLFVMMSMVTFAQDGKFREKKEQIKALKIAFLTDELSLTTAEAEKFWPIYNTFDEKQHEIRQQKMHVFKKRLDENVIDKMSEKDAAAFLLQMENAEDELYQLKKKFTTNLKGALPPVKIIRLKKAEEDFNRKLLKQYREKGQKR